MPVLRSANNPLTGQDGFTLVEMLVALVIVSAGFLAMLSMSLTILRTNQQNDIRNAAVRVASEMAEEIYAMPFDSVVSGAGTRTVSFRGAGEKTYSLTWTVTSQTNDLKEVRLSVQYSVPGGAADQTNTTVVYRHRAT